MTKLLWKYLIAFGFLAISAADAAEVVGRVILATGDTVAVRADKRIPLTRGAQIENGDTLETAAQSSLQVRFTDETVISLRERSRFAIEDFRFTPGSEAEGRSYFRLLQGAFRTITGIIARRDASPLRTVALKPEQPGYSVVTPVAVIGVRGTMYALGICQDDCTNADGSAGANGLYGSVVGPSFGTNEITITIGGQTRVFGQGQHFHVAPDGTIRELFEPPTFISATLARGQLKSAGGQGEAGGIGFASDSRANSLPGPTVQAQSGLGFDSFVATQSLTASGFPLGVNSITTNVNTGFLNVGGAGIVQGQLVWTTTADMDLHMLTPTNQEVFFGNRTVTFNGATAQLDVDNTSGGTPSSPAVENIRVTGSNVPAGNYTFFVRNFSGVGSTSVLRVSGDANATSRTHNVPTLTSGQTSQNFVVTRNPNGTATYNP